MPAHSTLPVGLNGSLGAFGVRRYARSLDVNTYTKSLNYSLVNRPLSRICFPGGSYRLIGIEKQSRPTPMNDLRNRCH